MRQWRLEEILGERVRERESETSLLTKARWTKHEKALGVITLSACFLTWIIGNRLY